MGSAKQFNQTNPNQSNGVRSAAGNGTGQTTYVAPFLLRDEKLANAVASLLLWSLELRRRKLIHLHNRWTNKNPYSGPRSDYIGLVRFSRWKLEHAAGTLLFVPFLAGVEKMRQEVAPRTRKKGMLPILPSLKLS